MEVLFENQALLLLLPVQGMQLEARQEDQQQFSLHQDLGEILLIVDPDCFPSLSQS